MNRWRQLNFYAAEKSVNGWTRFVTTAKYLDNLTLTGDGLIVEKETTVSGLFPNRFRNLSNALINIGVVPVSSPFQMPPHETFFYYVILEL